MSIFEKLFLSDEKTAISEILKSYKDKGYLVINYLYFANLISNGIIGNKILNKDFLSSLELGDFLLPDGIALNLYVKKYFGKTLHNLNGTDFSINFLSSLEKDSFNLILYGSQKEVIEKATDFIEEKLGIKVYYFQDGFSEFDFLKLENLGKNKINIFMVGLGTPKQEVWVKDNLENIKKYGLLTLTQGGTFDFWSGDVKRAPKIIINLKLEWLWRVMLNPKKNFKKVLNSFWLFWYLLKK